MRAAGRDRKGKGKGKVAALVQVVRVVAVLLRVVAVAWQAQGWVAAQHLVRRWVGAGESALGACVAVAAVFPVVCWAPAFQWLRSYYE